MFFRRNSVTQITVMQFIGNNAIETLSLFFIISIRMGLMPIFEDSTLKHSRNKKFGEKAIAFLRTF